VQHQVASGRALVDVILDDGKVLEIEREELGEDVVVVAADVDHAGVFLRVS